MAFWDLFRKKEEPVEKEATSQYPEWHEEAVYPQQPSFGKGFPSTQTPMPQAMPSLQPPSLQPTSAISITEKDIEVISAKLDTIKAMLENLNQRIANLERIARE